MRDLIGCPVIIGGGLAGLMIALHLAPEPVVVLSKAPLGAEASSAWSQGGVAAAIGADDDPGLHCADTLAAGNGMVDEDAARRIVAAAPAVIDELIRRGVHFDRGADGTLLLGREAAHSRRRIIHATGDGTGREIMRALVAAVRATPSVTIHEGVEARRLIVTDNAVAGVLAAGPAGPVLLPTGRVVIATGGIGGLFLHTTNPRGCFGQGLALAARAGAELADLEFVQFHPTALAPSRAARGEPLPLISEAVRGEGAVLVDERGERFMADTPGAELAPRDVVARAIWRHQAEGHDVFLDARAALGNGFAWRFPGIAAICAEAGIDPATRPIPVRPAAHYHMGGIAVDAAGRSTVSGLWACGEVARTGLHGANRLASNSLLEAAACARWVAESVAGSASASVRLPSSLSLPAAPDPSSVRPVLSRAAGVLRHADALGDAAAALLPLAHSAGPAADPAAVGLMIAVAALHRRESRGAHFRTDFPLTDDTLARPITWRLDDALQAAREMTPLPLARKA
ncbi:MAG TPA: L-aspartate oxidase [Acetobacteraceae bacterium]|nr:L-aspartate oxidase [Acetobacteraceae bacterium]